MAWAEALWQAADSNPPKLERPAAFGQYQRKELAEGLKFFRRVERTGLGEKMRARIPTQLDRAGILWQLVDGPSGPAGMGDAELDWLAGMLDSPPIPGVQENEWLAQLTLVAKAMHRVPESLVLLAGGEVLIETKQPVEEASDDWEPRRARPFDTPRERFLPPIMFIDRWSRGTLTTQQWLRVDRTKPKKTIALVVDASGSMDGEPTAIATATAIKMGQAASRAGHAVAVWFYATGISEKIEPSKVIEWLLARKDKVDNQCLGGGTNTGEAMAFVEEEEGPTDLVVISDLECGTDATANESIPFKGPTTKHYAPKADLHLVLISSDPSGGTQGWNEQAVEKLFVHVDQ